jgi:hypothetical protein
VEVEKEKKQRTRRAPRGRVKQAVSSDDLPERSTQSGEPRADFPHEWIAIAAYYLWKSEGEPKGREAYHWEKAKAELRRLQQEGILPANWQTVYEER